MRWPAIDTMPPMGTIENARKAGTSERYGARRNTGRSAVFGDRLLLEEELDAVGQRLQHAVGAGLHRAQPVLHVGDDLAHEPHVEHHRDEQEREHDDDLPMRISTTVRSMPPFNSGSLPSRWTPIAHHTVSTRQVGDGLRQVDELGRAADPPR